MKKKIMLGGSVLLVCLLFGIFWFQQVSQVMDAKVVSERTIEALVSHRTAFSEDVSAELLIGGVRVPYVDEEERYYISRNMEESHWKGTLSAVVDGVPASVVWMEQDEFSDMASAIRDSCEFRCVIYNDSGYRMVKVLFTGLPVMSIDGDMGEMGTRVALFDPTFSINGGYQVLESSAYYNIRGNASKRFEKIGYRLELFYDDGKAGRDESLLGMRSDNDWQLKAMYSDRSKLRDKLSIELWNQIAALTETKADEGCKMEYLELIVNGEYRGLYGLVEPTDYKSLELNKSRDLIYKMAADIWPDDAMFDESEAAQSFSCGGVNIRQSTKTYYPGIWEPFRTFWNSGYEMESEEDLAVLYNCIDRQNFIEYDLYYNVIAGRDNRFKNIIYSTVFHTDGTYTIRRIPWDQNYSWGDDFNPDVSQEIDNKNIRFNMELASSWLNEEVFRNMMEYDEQLPSDMLKTWKSWRENFLKEDLWKTYAGEQMAYLVDSGAFARDTAKWPDSENVEGTEEIESYIDIRFQWLDNYLQELAEQ